jgi:hypothetical protein
MNNVAPFGWTVVRLGGTGLPGVPLQLHVYKRDCPATGPAADLAPFTHPTRAKAVEAGKRGDYAYKL